jgi:hypothetical protein
MHTETVSDAMWRLLKRLDGCHELRSGYLGGGTALALQLGHRRSDDLDFFVPEAFNTPTLLRELGTIGLDITVLNQTSRHTELLIHSLKVDLIREQLPLKQPKKSIHPDIHSLKMADAVDIGFMKLIAIGSRGSRKDFVDLFCLTRNTIPLTSLIDLSIEENRGVKYSRLLFLKGLVDFEAADQEPDPLMIWDISWEDIKKILRKKVKEIASRWM